jgi:hypothetical protein
LRATYNRLVKDRKFRWKQYQYDICRINPDAWRHFITLADILYKEKIDPSRYLKVLAKYGFFSNKGIMPPLAWLAKPKALETYRWKVKREREMYPGKKDFQHHLNDPEVESSRNILGEVEDSAEQILDRVIDSNDVGTDTLWAVIMFSAQELSPWFLPLYLSREDVEMFEDDWLKRDIERCRRYFVRHKDDFKKAWRVARNILVGKFAEEKMRVESEEKLWRKVRAKQAEERKLRELREFANRPKQVKFMAI